MLKFIFLAALLANGALFAYQRGFLGDLIPNDREPNRAALQVQPDKVRLVGAAEVAEVARAAAAAASAAAAAAAAKKAESLACLDVGSFLLADGKRFETLLVPLALGERQSRRNVQVQEVASHLVYIPALATKEATDKKAGELRQLGVTDYFLINDNSPFRGGISLGVFKFEEAARSRLTALMKQGVHSAKLGSRTTAVNKLAYQFRNLAPDTKAALDQVLREFPTAEQRSCAPAPKPNGVR